MTNPRPLRFYNAFLALIAFALIAGGFQLVSLSGTPYYLLSGIALLASAILLWAQKREGLWLFGAIVAVTAAWSIWEVGFDGWALMPRIVAWLVVGAPLVLPSLSKRLIPGLKVSPHAARILSWRGFGLAVVGVVATGSVLYQVSPKPVDPRYQMGVTDFPSDGPLAENPTDGQWLDWGRDKAGTRFSPLTQIAPANVGDLELIWKTQIAIKETALTKGAQATPLMIDDTLYTCNGNNEIFAIDAETGAQRWEAETSGEQGYTCRGVAYFKSPNASGPCAERIIAATGVATLVAFDRQTGEKCAGFGKNGVVDLTVGLSKAPRAYYMVTSAPAIVRGKIILGGWVTDGQYWGEPSGVIRAFDAVSGTLSWAWDMGRPERIGAPAASETYTPATPNSWAPISADEELGLVYLPTGNATPDYFGGQRRSFDDKYSSSVVALDVANGRPRWSFQTVHHDVWDYDVASQPVLINLPKPGGGIQRALVQATKRGEVFVLDRETGKSLREIEERLVPQGGAVPEERLSPTQPFSVGMPSFRNPDIRERDMWGITPLDQMICRIRFRQARYEGPLTPPGLTPWITSPGTVGGMNWGSASIDPDHHVMIVTTAKVAQYSRLITRTEANARGLKPAGDNLPLHAGGPVPQANLPYAADVAFFVSPLFAPCQAPPYGFISAVDLISGKLIWTQSIGTARDTGPLGLASHLPIEMGTPLVGGAITTRSGLIFVGATADRTFRALDIRTGKELWQSHLPNAGFATPMTYISPRSGRQFVVIGSASYHGIGGASGANLLAYALPKRK